MRQVFRRLLFNSASSKSSARSAYSDLHCLLVFGGKYSTFKSPNPAPHHNGHASIVLEPRASAPHRPRGALALQDRVRKQSRCGTDRREVFFQNKLLSLPPLFTITPPLRGNNGEVSAASTQAERGGGYDSKAPGRYGLPHKIEAPPTSAVTDFVLALLTPPQGGSGFRTEGSASLSSVGTIPP